MYYDILTIMQTQPKFFKWALIIGIVVVLNLFLNYAISLFYKEPIYDDYFRQAQVVEPITSKEECLKVGGQWNEGDPRYQKTAPVSVGIDPQLYKGFCDPNYTKQQEFNDTQKVYQRNVFIMLVVFGVISLLLGAFIPNEIITLGLSWGGVLSFIIASVRYWGTADNIVKVLILGAALGALIWLAIKKFSNSLNQ